MSSKEARRPGLIQAALAGKITSAEAAAALGLSVRQVRRLKAAYRRAGVKGLVHGNRGRHPHNRLNDDERERIVLLIQGKLSGLNDCHLTEKLSEVERLSVSRETVRRLRRVAQVAPVRRRRAPQHRARRLRMAREGALVLVDGSEHLWFGPDLPRLTLLGALDDATGKILALRFRPNEDLHGYTELLDLLIRSYGLPCTLYGDRLSVFVRSDRFWTIEEELAGRQDPTQFGEMLSELAIGFIAAGSPQAKGRIERLWATLQDRLVAELRLGGITAVEAATAFLPEFIVDFNRRFAVPPRETTCSWRIAPRQLEHILACRYQRTVARDNTVSVPGRWIQLPARGHGRSWQGRKVEVRERLDGCLQVFHQQRAIAEQPWTDGAFTLMPRRHVARRRQHQIDFHKRPRIEDPVPPRPERRPAAYGLGHYTNVRRPKSDHPWKHPDKGKTRPPQAFTRRT